MAITFQPASTEHLALIMSWLEKEHVREFWDNSQAHKDDIGLFVNGRTIHSPYFDGVFDYWIGSDRSEPFSLIMTSPLLSSDELPDIWHKYLSKRGKTFSIDFLIGNERFLGKGLAAETLTCFATFFSTAVEPETDTFLIDPDLANLKAKHVYAKAGFTAVGRYIMESGVFKGQETYLMRLEVERSTRP